MDSKLSTFPCLFELMTKTLQTSPFLVGPQVSLIVYFLVKVNEKGFCLEKSMPSPTLPCFPGAVLRVFRRRAGNLCLQRMLGTSQLESQQGVAERTQLGGGRREFGFWLCHPLAVYVGTPSILSSASVSLSIQQV